MADTPDSAVLTAPRHSVRLAEIATERLKDYPLWRKRGRGCEAGSFGIEANGLWLHRRGRDWMFEANVIGDTFFLLSIEIAKQWRGGGLGEQLYEAMEAIAKQFGCRFIRQTPSGKTPAGKSRLQYLLDRGWMPWEQNEVYKELTP